MNRWTLSLFLTLAPTSAFAAGLPNVTCLPAQSGAVCTDAKPVELLGSNLRCELCASPAPTTPPTVDEGKELTSFCDALRMISVLSPSDEMKLDVATTDRTAL